MEEKEYWYIHRISGNTIIVFYGIVWALLCTLCNWIYSNFSLIVGIGTVIAFGLMAFHVYARKKIGVRLYAALIGSLISELSSMCYLLLCIIQAVDYVHDEPILGLFPFFLTSPLTFGAWVITKYPSFVATSVGKNWASICDGVVTLALVILFIWLFKMTGYVNYLL